MIRNTPLPHGCFHLLQCVNEFFSITPHVCNKLIPLNNSVISEFNKLNINGNQIQISPSFPNINKPMDHSFSRMLEF